MPSRPPCPLPLSQMPVPYNRYWTLSYPPLPPPVPVPWAPAVVEGRVGTPPSPPSPRMSPSRPRSPRTPRGGRNLPFMPPPSPFPPLEPSPPSPVPPSPPAASLPAGYRLAVSGVRLGAVAVPDGAVRFSGLDRFLVQGPVVNFVGRWVTKAVRDMGVWEGGYPWHYCTGMRGDLFGPPAPCGSSPSLLRVDEPLPNSSDCYVGPWSTCRAVAGFGVTPGNLRGTSGWQRIRPACLTSFKTRPACRLQRCISVLVTVYHHCAGGWLAGWTRCAWCTRATRRTW